MRLVTRLMRFFFFHFYHSFAWTYDFVAGLVSLGRWNGWIETALPYIDDGRILEIGHGPGHLQQLLLDGPSRFVVGLDELPQMGRLARRRLARGHVTLAYLTRGLAQSLPYASAAFDTVVSTFPAEYIFESDTMASVRRVLRDDGQFIVVPAAWIVGRKLLDRSAAWLFRVTGQAPLSPPEVVSERMRPAFEAAGFKTDFITIEMHASLVLVVIASK